MNGTLSEFLNLLNLRGQTWCFVDFKGGAGFSIPPNDAVLFYAVLQGQVTLAGSSGGATDLQPGNVAMVLSGEPHSLRSGPTGQIGRLDFLCDEHIVDVPPTITLGRSKTSTAHVLCAKLRVSWPAGLRRVSMPPMVMLGGEHAPFSSLSPLRTQTLQLTSTGAGAAALLTRLAALMLTLALRNHPQCLLLFNSSAWNDPIAYALHLISSDLAADWSVERLAHKVGMGRSSFAARFSAQVGRTLTEVIAERRMQYAVELLQQGDLKISELSERVGYRSEAAFSRRFRRHFGVSPGSMRRNIRDKLKKESSGSHAAWRLSDWREVVG